MAATSTPSDTNKELLKVWKQKLDEEPASDKMAEVKSEDVKIAVVESSHKTKTEEEHPFFHYYGMIVHQVCFAPSISVSGF